MEGARKEGVRDGGREERWLRDSSLCVHSVRLDFRTRRVPGTLIGRGRAYSSTQDTGPSLKKLIDELGRQTMDVNRQTAMMCLSSVLG